LTSPLMCEHIRLAFRHWSRDAGGPPTYRDHAAGNMASAKRRAP